MVISFGIELRVGNGWRNLGGCLILYGLFSYLDGEGSMSELISFYWNFVRFRPQHFSSFRLAPSLRRLYSLLLQSAV
jgi:hypothetical protein